jgi:hypothetical protein
MSDFTLENQPIGLSWKQAKSNQRFKIQFSFTCAVIVSIGLFFPEYFDFLEARNGKVLNDAILNMIQPIDVSWLTFFFLYFGLAIGISCNFFRPVDLLVAFQTYSLVTVMRIISLYFIPLNPPEGYIELKDPVLGLFFTNEGRICSKDLFFSGHVSTILSVYFSVQQRFWKNILLIFTVMTGVLVLVQHVHYTIDVIVAPVATYGCYMLSRKILLKGINDYSPLKIG